MTTYAKVTVSKEAITAFRLRLKGDLVFAGDEGYQQSREIHNAVIDTNPMMFVKVRDAADVSRSIHFARKHGLEIAVKSGGHSFAGYSLAEGGVVIDLSEMNEIRIDPEQRIAWAQAGATAGQFGAEAQKYGLAVPFGDAATVGLGGITLGGGIGFLARKHGLAIDNLVGVEMVTAEGQIVHASETENSELFWGLRGGGGNFGIVTGFQFRLVEVGMIYGGVLVLPATKDVIRKYGEVSHAAPDGLTTITMMMAAPPMPFIPEDQVGKLVLAIFTCFTGDLAEGEAAVAPLRAIAEPIADVVGPLPYTALYEMTAEATQRRREHVRSGFFEELDESMVDAILDHADKMVSPMGIFQIRPLGGQMARVSPDATAFSHRNANYLITVIDLWDEAKDDAVNFSWVEAAWEGVKDYHYGVYSNFLGNEGEARIREAYAQQTYERLGELKQRWDPSNVFHRNQNVAPKRTSVAAA